jgi:hypothetical protein
MSMTFLRLKKHDLGKGSNLADKTDVCVLGVQ